MFIWQHVYHSIVIIVRCCHVTVTSRQPSEQGRVFILNLVIPPQESFSFAVHYYAQLKG